MLGKTFANRGGNRAGTKNLDYEDMGYHEDDPIIELPGKSPDNIVTELRGAGFTGRMTITYHTDHGTKTE